MRLIDADLAAEDVKKSDLTNREKIALILCLSDVPTITPPPNDPLTLDELREMDGEPVWVEMLVKRLKSHWAIVHGKYMSDGRFTDDKNRCLLSIDENGGYGLAYLAYRRKPKEGTL